MRRLDCSRAVGDSLRSTCLAWDAQSALSYSPFRVRRKHGSLAILRKSRHAPTSSHLPPTLPPPFPRRVGVCKTRRCKLGYALNTARSRLKSGEARWWILTGVRENSNQPDIINLPTLYIFRVLNSHGLNAQRNNTKSDCVCAYV